MLLEKIHLEDDEQIITTIRKHWFVITIKVIALLILALLPLVGLLLFAPLSATVGIAPEVTATIWPYLIFGYLTWLLVLCMIAASAWTHYYLDMWVITTKRVILIDQIGFFRRFISSFRLERLQDMNIYISGVIPTLLNYGTVEAQTAGGSNEEFSSPHMPDPRGIKAQIIRAADHLSKEQAATIGRLRYEEGL